MIKACASQTSVTNYAGWGFLVSTPSNHGTISNETYDSSSWEHSTNDKQHDIDDVKVSKACKTPAVFSSSTTAAINKAQQQWLWTRWMATQWASTNDNNSARVSQGYSEYVLYDKTVRKQSN